MGAAEGFVELSHAPGGRPADPDAAGPAVDELGHNEHGSTAIEYALLASLIALVIFSSIGAIGEHVSAMFASIKF
ncbi:MAG: Flp family type IVb pilin [Alphaproteobacteria bacterium]|nr:Flp family type IVb pilin [Alphaproteobacteria bacterium]